MTSLYTAHATATGGRNGHIETSDGTLKAGLSMPKEMGGEGKSGATNPEQLFAASYAACFGGALTLVARNQGKQIGAPTVTAHVGIGKDETSFALTVTMEASAEGVSQSEMQSLMETAHQVCPYSKATRGNIQVTLQGKAAQSAAT